MEFSVFVFQLGIEGRVGNPQEYDFWAAKCCPCLREGTRGRLARNGLRESKQKEAGARGG